jgi:hypothetical protein
MKGNISKMRENLKIFIPILIIYIKNFRENLKTRVQFKDIRQSAGELQFGGDEMRSNSLPLIVCKEQLRCSSQPNQSSFRD